MNIAYIGHSYHQTTSSTKWFIELISKYGNVDLYWDDTWCGGERLDHNKFNDYDAIFVFQVEYIAQEIVVHFPTKIVFIPMWDGALGLPASWWASFGQARILSFSWAMHERLRRWGLNSFQAQYYPDPSTYEIVTEFDTLSGYLWQRRPEIGLAQVAKLSEGTRWDRFQLHVGLDPTAGDIERPNPGLMRSMNVELTRFFEDPAEARRRVQAANVYFCPRKNEGIGMSFLEAMARGQCVVSVNAPTMSEYIENNVTGLTYDLSRLQPLDFRRAKEIGLTARRRIEAGFVDWEHDRDLRIPEILFDRSGLLPPRTRAQAERWISSPPVDLKVRASPPKITVAIVCLNAASSFEETLHSALEQSFDDIEIVVVDGGSTDGTTETIRKYDRFLACTVSEPDDGPYDAMNKAARLGRGDYIIYMNSGDVFASRQAIERAFRTAPTDADFVFGHHVYLSTTGVEEFHRAAHFDTTWEALRNGRLDWHWLGGVPGHQATFTRRSMLLENNGYSPSFKIAADHEFMYRMRSKNAKFYHCGETVAIYAGGGLSSRREVECTKDLWRIARLYGVRRRVDRFFRKNYSSKIEIQPWSPPALWARSRKFLTTTMRGFATSLRDIRRRRRARRKA